jgi:hypothetical protein
MWFLEQWIGKDVEGNSVGLTWRTVPALSRRGWGKPLRTSIWICGVPAEVWNGHIPDGSQKRCHLRQLLCLSFQGRSRWGIQFHFSFSGWGETVHLVRRPLIGLFYQPRMTDECGAIGGMRIGRGHRNTRIKPSPVPLRPPQIPHNLTWAGSRAAAMGSRRLTAW